MNNKTIHTKIKKSALMLMTLTLISVVVAQENPGDSTPTADTEIICYAAKSKWVCAPADEKERAHDKAMKLVNEPESVETQDNEVAIQTLDDSDVASQVQEQPVEPQIYQDSVRDFTAREVEPEPVEEAQVVTEPATIESSAAADNSQEVLDAEVQEPIVVEPEVIAQERGYTEPDTSTNNNFTTWQNRYPSHWSLQVIGTSNRHNLNQFIIDNQLSQSTYAIVKTQVNDADWWVVMVGLYTSREAALANRDQLPGQLASGAWVRQISSIIGVAD